MKEEDMKKLKQTVDYFGHWYDVIGEERVAILEKVVNELEATKELQKRNIRAKFIIERLLANRPDTYSGTDVMTNQVKMFTFSGAVEDAIEYLKESE